EPECTADLLGGVDEATCEAGFTGRDIFDGKLCRGDEGSADSHADQKCWAEDLSQEDGVGGGECEPRESRCECKEERDQRALHSEAGEGCRHNPRDRDECQGQWQLGQPCGECTVSEH